MDYWCGGSLPSSNGHPVGPVEQQELLDAQGNNANWLMYGRTYNAHRYSPLKQINKKNVSS